MQLSLATFLERRGFQHNPFETTRAERERDLLPGWFRPSGLFDRIVGDPARPETFLLFAPTGHGKTSHRIEVARRVQERAEGPVLAVELADFDSLLRPGATSISLEAYLAQIHRLFLNALAAQLVVAPERLRRLQNDQGSYQRFCALLHLYARDLLAGFYLPAQIDSLAQFLGQQQLGAKQRLAMLVALAQAVGFVGVYILVDGIDELSETRNNPALMARMLAALLDAPGVLEVPGLAFKFFLPSQLWATLVSEQIGRLDIFRAILLDWSVEDLCVMLSTRIRMCSQLSSTSQGSTHCFSDLCATDFDVDRLLAAAAQGSPRALLQLCAEIVERHLRRTTDPDEPIAATTVHAALLATGRAAPDALSLAMGAAPGPAPTAPPAPAPAVPPLHIDSRGDVWAGTRKLEQRLPPSLRRLLGCLWANRDRVVPYHELFAALYGDDPAFDLRADPRESLRKLVGRLRKHLEPERANSYTYVDHISGVGYVLRNALDKPH